LLAKIRLINHLYMEILDKLFGSQAKVRIMRLFLFNQGESFDIAEIAHRVDLDPRVARREVLVLEKIGFLRRRVYSKEISRRRGRKIIISRKRTQGWNLEPKFPHIAVLQNLLIDTNLIRRKDILRKLQSCGRIKLVILAGVFIHEQESRVDMLIVGDNLKRGKIVDVIRSIETTLGKELKYASFETSDFNYRNSMYDKLIRDILDYRHETVVNKIGIAVSR
jgi:hypothetical protein